MLTLSKLLAFRALILAQPPAVVVIPTAPPMSEAPFIEKQNHLFTIAKGEDYDDLRTVSCIAPLAKRSGPTPAPWLRPNQRQRRLARRRSGL